MRYSRTARQYHPIAVKRETEPVFSRDIIFGEMVEWSKTSGLGPDLREEARVRTPLSSDFCTGRDSVGVSDPRRMGCVDCACVGECGI